MYVGDAGEGSRAEEGGLYSGTSHISSSTFEFIASDKASACHISCGALKLVTDLPELGYEASASHVSNSTFKFVTRDQLQVSVYEAWHLQNGRGMVTYPSASHVTCTTLKLIASLKLAWSSNNHRGEQNNGDLGEMHDSE